MKKKKVLVIVAHPDDETLWMGATLLRKRKVWDTTVVCLTRASDKDRAPKFQKVTKALGVKGCIYDLDDEHLHQPLGQTQIIHILKKFSDQKVDALFTHNKNGEYNHPRHIETHNAVVSALKKRILKAKKVFFFSYKKVSNNFQGYATYNSSADILIKLRDDELAMKKKLAIDVYGYDRKGQGFEELTANNPIESFDTLK